MNKLTPASLEALAKAYEGEAGTLNRALDKYSQPMRPGPDLAENHATAGQIMRGRQVNKSSKGKYPSNLTPPKKRRKK
jgi:hypothetical protein